MRPESQNLQIDSEQSLVHKTLARLDGYLKVVHHGNLIEPSGSEKTPRLCVYFRRLNNQTDPKTVEDFETAGRIERVHIPIAELMRLPLNVVIKNERLAFDPCTPLPSEKIREFSTDLSEHKVLIINRHNSRDDSGRLVLPFTRGRSPERGSDGDKAYYVAIEHEGDPYGLIIPCSEVFRFFYCSSSRMANTIMSDRILDVDRYIVDPAKSGLATHDPNIAIVWLRQWMFNCDRHHIARLLFTKHAFSEAQQIFLRAAGHGSHASALVARPPMHGPMKLQAIYKPLISNGRQRYFITRLISSNWTLNFKAIYYNRDNDNRTVLTDAERDSLPEDHRTLRSKILEEGTEVKILEDISPDDSIAPIEMTDQEFASRFPELEKIPSPQLSKENQKTKSKQVQPIVSGQSGSLIEPSSTSQDALVQVILTAMETAGEIAEELQEQNFSYNEVLEEQNSSKLSIRIGLIEKALVSEEYKGRLSALYLRVTEHGSMIRGKPVNILPIDHLLPSEKKGNWHYIDKAHKQPRPVVVIRLTFNRQTRYFIDFMHRENIPDTASLLLWRPDEGMMSKELLLYAIRTCAKNKGTNLKNGVVLKDLCGKALKHMEGEGAIWLIKKIFSAENKMEKLIKADLPADKVS